MSIRHPDLYQAVQERGYVGAYQGDTRWRHFIDTLERTVLEVERACVQEPLPADATARVVARVIDAHLPDARTRAERERTLMQTIDLGRARIPQELLP